MRVVKGNIGFMLPYNAFGLTMAAIPSAHFCRGITVPARYGDFVEFVEVVEGE
jgi:hypothetical protein